MTIGEGWGDGEWHDMLWGGGAYPYDPTVFLAIQGSELSLAVTGRRAGLAVTGHPTVLSGRGIYPQGVSATGKILTYPAHGSLPVRSARGAVQA